MNRALPFTAVGLCVALSACGTGNRNPSPGAAATTDASGADASVTDTSATNDASSNAGQDDSGSSASDTGLAGNDTGGESSDAGATTIDAAAPQDAGPADAGQVGCPKGCTLKEKCVDGKCVKLPLPCGGACPSGMYCDGTKCMGSGCSYPTKFGPNIQKVSYFQIAQSSQGCDLDGNKKPNNVFGNILKLYPAVNTELKKSIDDGLFVLLLEAPEYKTDGTTFGINGLLGDLDFSNSKCSPTSPFANCKYTVDTDNYAAGPSGTTCPAQVHFDPSTVKKGELQAGGTKGQTITISLPIATGLDVTLTQVTLQGYVKGPTKWTETKPAKLCGVITKDDFDKAIDSVPADSWKQINLTKEQVKTIIAAFVNPDIDINGDGKKDAMSIAMLFESVPGQISKIQ